MCTLTVRYRDGTVLNWNFERATKLVEALRLIKERGAVCKIFVA